MNSDNGLKIGLLSSENHPLLGHFLGRLESSGVPLHGLILDGLGLSDKDRTIIAERTGGAFEFIPLQASQNSIRHVEVVGNHNSPECLRLVERLRLDLLVNFGSPRILKAPLLKSTRLGVVGCHPGLLPRFRGCCCVEWAIHLDEPVGNSVYYLTADIDAGPVVVSEAVSVSRRDDYEAVRVKVYRHGMDLLTRGIRMILDGVEARAQQGGRYFQVMPDEVLRAVVEKLRHGKYKYQQDD